VPDVEQVHTVFEKYRLSTLKLNPGQERDITDDDNDLEPINQVDKKKYIRYILEPRPMDYDTDPDPDPADLRDLATEAIAHMGQKAKELGLISDTRLLITLGDKDTVCWNPDGSNELRMTVDPKLLKRLLMGPKWAHWNNAEIGSHIQFERIPDVFERGLHHIVSFLHV
jgi:UDP-MurNAc hydroxylase